MSLLALELTSALILGFSLGMILSRRVGGKSPSDHPPEFSGIRKFSTPPPGTEDVISELTQSLQESWTEDENTDKNRMEHELGTARVAQDMLFPPEHARIGDVEIAGFTRSLSECSGDWWHYAAAGGKLWVCIADAIGHGVAAALLTSAAKSAFSLMELLLANSPVREDRWVSWMMECMNTAIHKTSRGTMHMSFFLVCIDLKTQTLRYSNASHVPPLLMTKDLSFQLLQNSNSIHLGYKPDTRYSETEIAFGSGDRFLLYTDGATDLTNAHEKQWRLKGLAEAFRGVPAKTADQLLTGIRSAAFAFAGTSPLPDDMTLVACTRR